MGLPRALPALLVLLGSALWVPGGEAQEWEDRAALLELKSAFLAAVATQQPDALPLAEAALQQWNNATYPCRDAWPHLNCTLGRVGALSLASCGLAGPIPESISRLGALSSVSLRSNVLTGPIPGLALARLVFLRDLDLGFNRFQGPLPDALSALVRLTSLALPGNLLSGALPPSLSALTDLQVLDLSGNHLQGIPEDPRGPPGSHGGPLPDLSRSTGLRVLSLAVNKLVGAIPTWLGSLPQLSILGLRDNQFTGSIPASLGGATALQRVYLSGNRLTGPLPASVGALTRLELLLASQNQLQGPLPSTLGAMVALRQLDLSFNPALGGPIPDSFTRLSALELLRLSGCALSGPLFQNVSQLGTRMGSLEQLLLSGNQLSGGIPSGLCSLPRLRTLDLGANKLTGPIPGCLVSSPSLQGLRLSHNLLSGDLPTPLSHAGPSTLTDFRYDHNCLSGDLADQNLDPLCPPPGGTGPSGSPGAGAVPLAAILGGAGLVLALVLLAIAVLALRRRAVWPQGLLRLRRAKRYAERPPVPRLSWDQVRQSTWDFGTVLGQGDFGVAYAGTGEHCGWPGREVVVKRAKDPAVLAMDEAEFEKKVVSLCRARHSYVVNVLGYCSESRKRVLVYEHLPEGSLQRRLHGGDDDAVPWAARIKIAATLAAALEHLHNGVGPPMVHGAVSSAHVLLTKEMAAKVADVGLARPTSSAKKPRKRKVKYGEKRVEEVQARGEGGEQVAVVPDLSVRAGEQVDVYGFGVVLLELITGQPERKDEVHITTVAAPFLDDPAMTALMVDPQLANRFNLQELLVLASLAASCTSPDPSLRPSMREVVLLLEEHLDLDPSWLRPPHDPSLPEDLDVEELYGAAATATGGATGGAAGSARTWASWGFLPSQARGQAYAWPLSGSQSHSGAAGTGEAGGPRQWLSRLLADVAQRLRGVWPAGARRKSGKESPEHGPNACEAGGEVVSEEPLASFDEALILLKGARSAALL